MRVKTPTPLKAGCKLIDLLRRPELSYADLAMFDPERPELPAVIREQVEIRVKYAGYIERQMRDVEQYRKLQSRPLPLDLDYKRGGLAATGSTSETERRQAR